MDLASADTEWLIDSAPHSAIDIEPDPKSGDPAPGELDYALLRLATRFGDQPAGGNESEGEPRWWLKLDATPIDFAHVSTIGILQHPNSEPLKLALGMEQDITANAAGNRIRYKVPTLPGSSGAPVFDSDWRLIALHHAGDPSTIKPEFNEAVPISLIASQPEQRCGQGWADPSPSHEMVTTRLHACSLCDSGFTTRTCTKLLQFPESSRLVPALEQPTRRQPKQVVRPLCARAPPSSTPRSPPAVPDP